MNNSNFKKLYNEIESAFHEALSTENRDEYTKIIINKICKPIAIKPELDSFRAFYKKEGLNKRTIFKKQQLTMLQNMQSLIGPLLLAEQKVIALKNINFQYKTIINSKQPLDLQIFNIKKLLKYYCNSLMKDMRFNSNQNHTELLKPLAYNDSVCGIIFLFDQTIATYEQAQADFEKFDNKSLYTDIGNLINLYQIKGMISFTGENPQTLHQVDCNKTIRRVLDAIQEWIASSYNNLILSENISYDSSTGYLVIIHNTIHHKIKFGKKSLRGKILEILFPAGKPCKESISFAEIYDEVKQQKNHNIWDEFDCIYFDDLDSDNDNEGENLIKSSQEKVKKSIRDSIDGNNAINDKILKKTGFEKIIFIDNLNVFVRCH